MPFLRTLLVVSVSLLGAVSASAQTMLELLPQEAAAGIAIRSLDELIERGDKFLDDSQIKLPLRPSDLFGQGALLIGVNKGLDRKRPGAVVVVGPEKGQDLRNHDFLENLVAVLPFTDADAMAGNYKIDKGKLTDKEIHKIAPRDFFVKAIGRAKDHVHLGFSEKAVRRLQQGTPVARALTPAQRKLFDEGDVVLHFGKSAWRGNDNSIADLISSKIRPGSDPKEKEFAEAFAKSLLDVENAVVGVRLADGIDGHFLATVAKDGHAVKMLAALNKDPRRSTLDGLPDGNLLFAQASIGGGEQAMIAKGLFHFLLEDILIRDKVVANVDRLKYLGIFHEVWSRLESHRLAVYQNPHETKQGLFSAIAILDLEDPSAFLREMKTLARMSNADKLDWSKAEVKEEIDIPRLVKNLDSQAFPLRQSAYTKLLLIGEPALPYLQKAIDAKNLELESLRRCQELRQTIGDAAAERRKELLRESDRPLFPRPLLAFVTGAEKRLGLTIDGVQITIEGSDKIVAMQKAEYKQLLGPDWDKVRVAVVGKQIVLMLGSNLELFDAALQNLQNRKAGLAASKRVTQFYERSGKDRTFEFHVSVEGILRLTTPMAKLDGELQLTSVALSLGETSMQLDARVPTAEVRAIARKVQDGMK